jgi:selenide, water dikinase
MSRMRTRRLVLLGIGHTNAHVVRMWRSQPIDGVRLVCVSDHAVATYSGMLPGALAGQYARGQMQIDLARLAASAGAELVVGEVSALDLQRRQLLFRGRAPVDFDVLSIGIGSVPSFEGVSVADDARIVAIKPMQTFLDRLDAQLRQASERRATRPLRIVVVGGGAGGVEVAMCLPAHLRLLFGDAARHELTVLAGDDRLLPGSADGIVRRVSRLFARRGVGVLTGTRVTRVDGETITATDGRSEQADVVIWATGAAAPPVLAHFGLPLDDRGFVLTTDTLQTTSGAPVFAVGDTGSIAGTQVPKAGVYAVRQAPVLWENLRRTLAGTPLERYRPQRGFLKLMNSGDGRAIGEWKGTSFEGRWAWRLKDFIDRRFIAAYQA